MKHFHRELRVFLYFKTTGLSKSLFPHFDGDRGAGSSLRKRAVECDEKQQLTQSWGNASRLGPVEDLEGTSPLKGQLPLSFRQCLPSPECSPSVDSSFLSQEKLLLWIFM